MKLSICKIDKDKNIAIRFIEEMPLTEKGNEMKTG
jgi:hypothetical protein